MTRRPRKPDTRPPSSLRRVWWTWADEHPELCAFVEAQRTCEPSRVLPVLLVARVVEDVYHGGRVSDATRAELLAHGWSEAGPLSSAELEDAARMPEFSCRTDAASVPGVGRVEATASVPDPRRIEGYSGELDGDALYAPSAEASARSDGGR